MKRLCPAMRELLRQLRTGTSETETARLYRFHITLFHRPTEAFGTVCKAFGLPVENISFDELVAMSKRSEEV